MTTQEINKAVDEYSLASKRAEDHMRDHPQEWDSWLERVEFQYRLFNQYLKEIRNVTC